MALNWHEQLNQQLITSHGQRDGNALAAKYQSAFSPSYCDDCAPTTASADITHVESLTAAQPLISDFYQVHATEPSDYPLRLRLYQWQQAIPLSDILPILDNLNLRADSERPYKITLANHQLVWISDFAVAYPHGTLVIDQVKDLLQQAFANIYHGICENDGLNKLVLGAALSWREITILRCYSKYLKQVGFRFSQPYIETALAAHPDIAKDLVQLFIARHTPPNTPSKALVKAAPIQQRIEQALTAVTSLDEDRILRRLLDLIQATLRTNYFQTTQTNTPKDYLAIKLNSHAVPELPLPTPQYEIFVYAPHFEAIHLRHAKVARGGIRWSDRREDFRTEILGLMKAQIVKNAVIVPTGAKGGFVLKAPQRANATQCYQAFISGLLDLTDNITANATTPPPNTVCYDDSDPYLVVAADKGTASFSDTANAIAETYHFWLGDAFASGGTAGYDHKKIGITARGAWESIKRHFRELNIDVMNTPITVIGIGDMSGDVFGNGMQYSNKIKLVGAFDHRHVFIDPTPNPDISHRERARLFALPRSSWQDYNAQLISPGGGVFDRSLKSIALTPAMQALLATQETALTPTDLIRALLKAPVDLLFNGGIGTYVKANSESQADVGDRTNDYCRINGNELRAKVVGEGGNLGFTQLGRVEFALTGGLINTDFIDNSGGVDCSDHEVNLKILFAQEIDDRRLTYPARDTLLASLTTEVAALVLQDNFHQALVMSFSAYHAKRNLGLHISYIKELETLGILNRKLEYLPDDKTLLERKAAGLALTRPELAVLLAYSKIHIKAEILNSTLTDDPYLQQVAATAFPPSLTQKYHTSMTKHRLNKNIIATQLSNQVVNQMGFTFIYRLQIETGAAVDQIIRAYLIASRIFNAPALQDSIEALNFKIPMSDQYDMLYHLRTLLNLSTRWFLHSPYLKQALPTVIEQFTPRIAQLEAVIPTLMSGYTQTYLTQLTDKFAQASLSLTLARRIATYRAMYTALNIIDVALTHKFDLLKTAQVYFTAGERINLVWIRDQIAADSRDGHWNILARLTLRDELDICQRTFAVAVMKNDQKTRAATDLIDTWFTHNQLALSHWNKLLDRLNSSAQIEYTMFFIAIRELSGLLATSQ